MVRESSTIRIRLFVSALKQWSSLKVGAIGLKGIVLNLKRCWVFRGLLKAKVLQLRSLWQAGIFDPAMWEIY